MSTVTHEIRVDVHRIVIVDMDVAIAVHIVLFREHDQAVAVDGRLFLAEDNVAYQGLEGVGAIGLVIMIGVIMNDLDEFGAIVPRSPKFHMAHLCMDSDICQQTNQEKGYGDA
jgi:hypothetical protein